MAKYRCQCRIIEIHKTTMQVVNGKVVVPEAYCKDCKTYGKFVKEHKGFATIIKKPNGTVSKKI